MKKDILKNISLDSKEKVYKDFRKLSAKGYFCSILLTTKRLIIYSNRKAVTRGKKVKRKQMNEIDINSIHRLEYYIDYYKNHIIIRLLGLIILLGAMYGGYLLYMGKIPVPASIPFQPYIKYIAVGLLALLGLLWMFDNKKTLYFKINSSTNQLTVERFVANKYNESAMRYIASKVQSQI